MIRTLVVGIAIAILWMSVANANDRDLCGAYCAYLALKSIDVPVESYERLQEDLGAPPAGGYRLGQLNKIAQEYGAHTLGVETTIDSLRLREAGERFACIAHLKQDHFVLLSKITPEGVVVIDPPHKNLVPFVTWQRDWDGVALLLSPTPLRPEEDLRRPWRWEWVAGGAALLAIAAAGRVLWKRQH